MSIEDFTIGKMMIGKREYEVKECMLAQADLNFYSDNPRVYSVLRNFDDTAPSQVEIEKHMCNMDHVKQLKLSIKQNGGLIDPLIVRDGDFSVLEGNSRLASYRLLNKTDPIEWGKVKCRVLPSDIDDSSIFTLLGQYHIVGRKDWSPYEQAGYLYRRKRDTKIPVPDIAKELGIVKSTAINYIKVFEYMKSINDLTPERWSYYDEFLKNRAIRKKLESTPDLEKIIVQQIQSGEIETAADVRKIGKIAGIKTKKAKKIIEEYVKGEKDIYTAYRDVQDSGSFDKVYQKVHTFRDFVIEESFMDNVNHSNKKSDIIFCLKKINKKINSYLKESDKRE